MSRYCWTALLLCALAQAAGAAEAVVTKVRGLSLNEDKGADHGLVVGVEVAVVRPPGEAVIHPITGENLGKPEIRLAAGAVAKVSAGAGVVRLKALPLMPVRAGDVIRFVAAETPGAAIQEQLSAALEKKEEAQERQQLKSDVSSLTRDVKSIQTTIHTLENMVQRLEKVDERMRAQLQGINTDVNALKREMAKIRETVATLISPDVKKVRGEKPDTLSNEQLDHLRQIIQEEITKLRAEIPPETTVVQAAPAAIEEHHPEPEHHEEVTHEEAPAEEEHHEEVTPEEEAPAAEEPPFYTTTWFMGSVGGVGVLGLGYYLFSFFRSRKGSEGEEEEEEPEAEVEVEEEEEDDIVVEESK
jgi:prefoldin subunit 5